MAATNAVSMRERWWLAEMPIAPLVLDAVGVAVALAMKLFQASIEAEGNTVELAVVTDPKKMGLSY